MCSDQRAAQVSKAGECGESLRCPKDRGGGSEISSGCQVGQDTERTHAYTTTEAQLNEDAGGRLQSQDVVEASDTRCGFKYYMSARRGSGRDCQTGKGWSVKVRSGQGRPATCNS